MYDTTYITYLVQFIEIKRIVVAGAARVGSTGEFNECRVSVCNDEKILEIDSGGWLQSMYVLNVTELYT